MNNREQQEEGLEKRNMKRADWGKFKERDAWSNLVLREQESNDEILKDLYNRFDRAAEHASPKVVVGKYYPRPFWTEKLKQTREVRERLYKKYRRRMSPQNYVLWKKAKAEHRKALKEEKRKALKEFASNLHVELRRQRYMRV